MDDKTPLLIDAAPFAWRGEADLAGLVALGGVGFSLDAPGALADDGQRSLFIPG